MKTLKTIQIVASAIGLIIALRCVDSFDATNNELLAGMALALTSGLGLIGQRFYTETEE